MRCYLVIQALLNMNMFRRERYKRSFTTDRERSKGDHGTDSMHGGQCR